MAYGTTFLEAVNSVLRDLRENEVATWTSTPYSKLIGAYVNAVKREVENAWQWHDLRSVVQFNTTAGVNTYILTGTTPRTQVLSAWNATRMAELSNVPAKVADLWTYGSTAPAQASPSHWWQTTKDVTTGELRVVVYPTPSAAESLVFRCYTPTEDFTTDGQLIVIPARPIIEGAIARAKAERGEDGGAGAAMQVPVFNAALASAIAMDAARDPGSLVLEVV